jgi:hypothetical protein
MFLNFKYLGVKTDKKHIYIRTCSDISDTDEVIGRLLKPRNKLVLWAQGREGATLDQSHLGSSVKKTFHLILE